MSDEGLFPIYEGDYRKGRKPTAELFIDKAASVPDRLTVARARQEAAERAWDECVEMDNSPIRGRIGFEAEQAKAELQAAELERMHP